MKVTNYTMEEIEEFLGAYKQDIEFNQTQSMKKLLSIYDKIPIFKNINPNDLQALVYDLTFVKCKYKEFIVKENDKSTDIFFLIDGECHVFHHEKQIGKLQAGMVFGEAGVIFETNRNASVVCASDKATLLSFKIDEENSQFASKALAILYKNLALQINAKLEKLNDVFIHR